MWIQANPSTRQLKQVVTEGEGDKAKTRTIVADFNQNGRAKVSDADGEILLAMHPGLKKVKDGGSSPKGESSEPTEAE